MALTISPESAPIKVDEYGAARVSGTRVTLDTVVIAFWQGATAEEIVQQYPTLPLADVYSVIGYYLSHRDEADAYLREREKRAQEVRKENEARFGSVNIRERLLSRLSRQANGK